ncbi:hypothetical protein CVT24_002937 [Panaeolus cyanescens]|uniref:Core-binding (CB) domain-containing protein n=1 Tax=Panaeolus cyanescens TaxID=181874 RepID=A0A409WT69_9AGAR|nr:hypothetical protein CVT24_002937 [Panaeolus cyanescens]
MPHDFFVARAVQSSFYSTTFSPSRNDVRKVEDALKLSWAPSTQKAYSSAIKHFQDFCEKRRIPVQHRFPTHESVLLIYAASDIGRVSASTVQRRLSALKTFHVLMNLPWHGSARLSKMLRGIKISTPASSKRPRRSPVTSSMISLLISRLNLRDPFDTAVAACACTAFWGQCRLGELLPSSTLHTTLPSVPARAHLTRPTSRSHASPYFNLHLPQTKMDRQGQLVTLLSRHGKTDPLTVLRHHLAINNLPPHTPLFSFAAPTPSGFTIMSKSTFLARCNSIWESAGHRRITGHSFRIGGTTKFLSMGVPPDVVRVMGRWSSDSFLRYWRHIDRVAPAQTPSRHRSHPRIRSRQ